MELSALIAAMTCSRTSLHFPQYASTSPPTCERLTIPSEFFVITLIPFLFSTIFHTSWQTFEQTPGHTSGHTSGARPGAGPGGASALFQFDALPLTANEK